MTATSDGGVGAELADAVERPPESVAARVAAEAQRRLFGSALTETEGGHELQKKDRPLRRGDVVGRYVVLAKIGEGGMAEVFQAYDSRLDRSVALKFVRSGKGRVDAERLAREAKAMARLRHPNVVAVHDVGEADRGPFVAMDFVEGTNLADWLSDESRDWRQIVRIFRSAGQGLVAAHATGTVHRDFKPANVLVDGNGIPLVADFGLATGIGGSAAGGDVEDLSGSDITRLTQTRAFVGTPAYASPEQFCGEDVGTGSDQFSFCAALWEALYRQRPFEGATVADLMVSVPNGEIQAPASGSGVPPFLEVTLRRGLARDPGKRWPSMKALLRALAHDPVAVRRRRLRWAAAGLVVAAVAGAVGVLATRTTPPCSDASRRLAGIWSTQERDDVRAAMLMRDAKYTEHVWSRISTRLDDYAREWVEVHRVACEATRVHGEQSDAMLDARMRCLDGRLNHLGATVAVLAAGDDEVIQRAIQVVDALPALDRCSDPAALAAVAAPPDDPAVAKEVALIDEGLATAAALRGAGRYNEGGIMADELAARAEGTEYEPVIARAKLAVGRFEAEAREYERAAATFTDAYFGSVRLGYAALAGEAATEVLWSLGQARIRFDEARLWGDHALAYATLASDPKIRAEAHLGLGTLHQGQGEYAAARREYEAALEVEAGGYGGRTLSSSALHNDLGTLCVEEGDFEGAVAALRTAVSIAEDHLGPYHPRVAIPLMNLGAALGHLGEQDEALATLERALTIRRDALGDSHPDVAYSLSDLANLQTRAGDHASARRNFEEALAIVELGVGPEVSIAASLNGLGSIAEVEGRYDDAYALYERARVVWATHLGEEHPVVASAHGNLGNIAGKTGDLDGALEHHERALAIREKALGSDHVSVGITLNSLGEIQRARGQLTEAVRSHERSREVRAKALGADHVSVATPLVGLGLDFMEDGRHRDALPVLRRARDIRERGPASAADLGTVHFALARALWDSGEQDTARVSAQRAHEAFSGAEAGEAAQELGDVTQWIADHR